MQKSRKPAKAKLSDRQLRAWIFERVADADIEAKVAIEHMQAYFDWVKFGKRPGPPKLEIVRQEAG